MQFYKKIYCLSLKIIIEKWPKIGKALVRNASNCVQIPDYHVFAPRQEDYPKGKNSYHI